MIRRIAALTMMVLLAGAALTPTVMASPDQEAAFVALVNQERAGRGLNTLDVYWDLVDDARIHSNVMHDAGDLFHSSNLASVTTGWSALGENVGVGPTVSVLHNAFMNSPGHRDNILGDWDSVGVGVTQSSGGPMYVTVVFMKGADPQPAPAPAPSPAPAPESPQPVPQPVAPAPVSAPTAVAASAPVAASVPVADPPPADPEPPRRASVRLADLMAGRSGICII